MGAKKLPFRMTVVTMKEPFAILTVGHATRNQILEVVASLLQEGHEEIDRCFKLKEFDIQEDVYGTLVETGEK